MQNSFDGRSRVPKVFTDPVVVGLGRLLIVIGALLLAALLSVGWLLLRRVT